MAGTVASVGTGTVPAVLRSVAVAVSLLLATGACSTGSDDDEGTTGATTTSRPAASPTTADDQRCAPADLTPLDSASPGATVTLDADGDDEPDSAGTYRTDEGWFLWVDAPGGGTVPIPMEDRTAEPRPLGGHDVDGDGADELFVEVSSGASASVVLLARVVDCTPLLVQAEGGGTVGLRFPVGASAATQQGLRCEGIHLVAVKAGTDDGSTYEWREDRFALDGDQVRRVDERSGMARSPADDGLIRSFGALECGEVRL